MDDAKKLAAHIVSAEGAAMMTLEGFDREGDNLAVQGALMGSWSTTMYMSADDVWAMMRMFLRPRVIGYMIRLPFTRRRLHRAAAH